MKERGRYRAFGFFTVTFAQLCEWISIFWRCLAISPKNHVMNEDIRAKEVRVVDTAGGQLGIMQLADALKMASDRDLDLVLIAPQATPPVCRVMDYGKFRFEQQKHDKEVKKNQKVVELKEIRLSINIGDHDVNTKLSHAIKFLSEGNKVKASIRFRGREMAHTSLGYEVMARFADALAEHATIEKPAKLEGRSMQMIMTPIKKLEEKKSAKD